MSDYEIFCVFVSAMKRIGDIKELNLNESGGLSVNGNLLDGREVHLFVMAPAKVEVSE